MIHQYKEPITKLSLLIDEKFVVKIASLATEYYPREIGGFFIGKYIEDNKTAIITDIRTPAKFTNGITHFYRDTHDLNKYLLELQKSNTELLYLGEWHSHPNGVAIPSNIDRNMMLKIAGDSNSKIQNPILGIISIIRKQSDIEFYVVHNGEILKYEKAPLYYRHNTSRIIYNNGIRN